jgi:hypothetical protein
MPFVVQVVRGSSKADQVRHCESLIKSKLHKARHSLALLVLAQHIQHLAALLCARTSGQEPKEIGSSVRA